MRDKCNKMDLVNCFSCSYLFEKACRAGGTGGAEGASTCTPRFLPGIEGKSVPLKDLLFVHPQILRPSAGSGLDAV